jgi:hypothetical protein
MPEFRRGVAIDFRLRVASPSNLLLRAARHGGRSLRTNSETSCCDSADGLEQLGFVWTVSHRKRV